MPDAAGASLDAAEPKTPRFTASTEGAAGGADVASIPDVLVVDDDARNRAAMGALLEGLGARVLEAGSGEEALRTLLARDVALILLDVQLPGLSGLETAALVRSRERTRWVPIIFLTAHSRDVDLLRRGYALGAVDFLSKPVVPEEALRGKAAFFIELHRRGEALRRKGELLRAAHERELHRNVAEARRVWEEEALRRDVERERRVVETLHRANERLRLLSEIREDLLSARTVRERLGAICARAGAHLGLERHAVWAAEPDGRLGLVAHGGTDAEAAARLAALDPAALPADAAPGAIAALLGGASALARRCTAEGRTVAVVAFASTRADACDGEVAATLSIVADGLAMALERDRLFQELQQRNAALGEVDRRKDHFLAMLGHELRNPLAPILNAVKLLQDGGADEPVRRRALDAADRQVRHMARLVDDLLDVTRIRSGKVRLRKERLDLVRVVEAAVQTAEPILQARRHALALALPAEPLPVEGDPVRLTQVVLNLIGNAAKYTDPGGHVRVALERGPGEAILTVEDDGIGIAPELLPRIFDAFVQAEQAVDRSRGGLGIGLALVRSLVEMHGGVAAAASEGPGRGARFVVRLPALEPSPAAAPPPVPEAAPAAGPRRWRLLVVEDNEDIRVTLAELLRMRGHRVAEAEDGTRALALAAAERPDAALVDIGLPGLDGYGLARRLREVVPGTRLVAMTGYGSPEDRRRSAEAGFRAHVVKPVEIEELTALLAQLD